MTITDLTQKKCVPCEGGTPPLTADEIAAYQKLLGTPWDVSGDLRKISRGFKFKNFATALEFINKVGKIAEQQGHHPDIYLHNYNKVRIDLWTHAIGGLSENDFIMAAKINAII
ncbi:MAG TPA: 4a-hydroxytetrahydrobiopterin dehydratase [Candidatus Dojkabacteria bacterium]|nr:4a-hydroxytetrahydrobiopterin dehydratase [Candidatus Dojkabacteria bacterium]